MKNNNDDEPLLSEKNDKDKIVHREDLKFLLDSSYPLLHQFRELCPGTFKHSQSVASMIENIALSLGLDTVLMKVAAFYHDVGKLFNPLYFSENQLEDDSNPHDVLSPDVSYNIITRHVSDTVMILVNNQNFPRDVIEIVSQHHGTTVLQYFYEKAGKGVEDTFRYKTTKPTCVESALLMIVDRAEATARSMVMSNKFDLTQVIDRSINILIEDSQLDNVVIRFGDLKKIKEALTEELKGTYSKRIDYTKAKEGAIDNSILDNNVISE